MDQAPPRRTLKARVRELYYGRSRAARAFGFAMLAFDIGLIVFFVVLSFLPVGRWIIPVDIALAMLLMVDLGLRMWSTPDRLCFWCRLTPVADLIVIASLMVPTLTESYAFLRVMRAMRLFRSYHVLGEMRRRSTWVRRNEEPLLALVHLGLFLFVITAVVYVTQVRENPEIDNYVDALYFTVTALTTTGFGDITLVGTDGRLLSVLIMVVGIGLFVRLAQALFRPNKIRYVCPVCGLSRHDPDAVHCKHCGTTISIPTEGG